MVKRVLVAVLMMCPAVVLAQAPQLLGYQGRLVKTDGTPESGNAQMRFGLFGTETGGSSLWEETQAVSITQGYYSTYLGRMTMFPATLFDTGTLWLEVAVQAPGDTQFRTMTPRQRVGSVAFALNARSVKGGTVDATSVSVNGTQVIDSNGKLTASAGYSAGPGISIDGTTRAISVNSSGCNTGQVLQWNGTAWQCATVSGGGGGGISGVTGNSPITVMNSTTAPVISVSVGTTSGTVAAGDDSRFGNATSLLGRQLSASIPDSGMVLTYSAGAWVPQYPPGGGSGGLSSVTAGTGLTGGTITSSGTIAIADGGVGNAQIADQAITAGKLASMGCTNGQVLQYNGTAWVCATIAGASTLGRVPGNPGTSCKDIKNRNPAAENGVYLILPTGSAVGARAFPVYCDMTRDGGGWTLIMRVWYQSGLAGVAGAVGSPYDAQSSTRVSPYKLADTTVRLVVGNGATYELMADQVLHNTAYSTGNNEFVIVRNYTGQFTYTTAMPESTTPTTFESFRVADNELAWRGRLQCGNAGYGLNCNGLAGGSPPNPIGAGNPQGGLGCLFQMGSSTNPNWHDLFMGNTNTDTYIYICNGAQHTSSYSNIHRWWVR